MPPLSGMVFLLPSLPYGSFLSLIFVHPVVVLFPYTIVVATPAPNHDGETGRKATKKAARWLAVGLNDRGGDRAICGGGRLGGGSGNGHIEHPPHEQPGMSQQPPNPTMTFRTPSRCC